MSPAKRTSLKMRKRSLRSFKLSRVHFSMIFHQKSLRLLKRRYNSVGSCNDALTELWACGGSTLEAIWTYISAELDLLSYRFSIQDVVLPMWVILNFLVRRKAKSSVSRVKVAIWLLHSYWAWRIRRRAHLAFKMIDNHLFYMGKIRIQSFEAK